MIFVACFGNIPLLLPFFFLSESLRVTDSSIGDVGDCRIFVSVNSAASCEAALEIEGMVIGNICWGEDSGCKTSVYRNKKPKC